MLEGFKAPRLKINPREIIDRHPPHFSIDEIVEAELPKARKEVKDNLRETLEDYFAKEIEIKEKEALAREVRMVRDWENFQKEKRKEDRENKKEEELKILEELKEMMDDDFIKEQRELKLYEHYGQKDIFAFWVGVAAKVLAKAYFEKINKKPTSKEMKNLRGEIKKEYYDKKKSITSNPSGPIPNFYESQREQREGLEDDEDKDDDNEEDKNENLEK